MLSLLEKIPAPLISALARAVDSTAAARHILDWRVKRWRGRKIDWKNPRDLFDELAAYYIDTTSTGEGMSLFAKLADKIAVRDHVSALCPDLKMAGLLGTWEHSSQIDWDSLPDRFALKTNHGCGTNIIVTDRNSLDRQATGRRLESWLKFPYGPLSGQRHYSRINPLIFAEEYLDSGNDALPVDYKIYCVQGEPIMMVAFAERVVNGHLCATTPYRPDGTLIPDAVRNPRQGGPTPLPESYGKMLDYARSLSKGLKICRIDFYQINGQPYFGEITLFPDLVLVFNEEFLVSERQRLKSLGKLN